MRQFIASESAGGVLLGIAALFALVLSNSELAPLYERFVQLRVGLRWGDVVLLPAHTWQWWVNDFWMALFFFLVGLEIKREVLVGELSTRRQAALPVVAAIGGMVVPALIYVAFNHADPVAVRGWAIPTATDIAFALAVLMGLGARVPASLKVFVTAVAIIDDLGAIAVIAFFYTADLALPMLLGAALGGGALALLNRAGVTRITPYALVGLLVWVCVLNSGVHATLAGVVTALAIPLRGTKAGAATSPLERTEHALHPWVAFGVLPMFAFVNAGVALHGVAWATLAQPVPLGIALGLVAGKAIGVFGATCLLVRFGGFRLPHGASPRQFFGVCVLCGIGFTMSLFIGDLAFTGQGALLVTQLKLGVLGGSLGAGLIGAALLWSPPRGR